MMGQTCTYLLLLPLDVLRFWQQAQPPTCAHLANAEFWGDGARGACLIVAASVPDAIDCRPQPPTAHLSQCALYCSNLQCALLQLRW